MHCSRPQSDYLCVSYTSFRNKTYRLFCITTGNKVNLKILFKIELGGDVIRCILHSSVNSCTPVYEYKPHLKEQIKSAHNSVLQRRNSWIREEIPYGIVHYLYKEYKQAKRKFKMAQVSAYVAYKDKVNTKLEDSTECSVHN